MTKEKYDRVINSNLTILGVFILTICILVIISTPMFIFPLTGVFIYDILLSILIIVLCITVIGVTILIAVKIIVWDNKRRGYHDIDIDCMCLNILTKILNTLSFIVLYFGGDWR